MILGILCLLVNFYFIVLLAYVVFSWVPRPPEPIMPLVRGVRALVEPIAAPLRRLIPPLRAGGVGLDLSIIVVFLIVFLLQGALC